MITTYHRERTVRVMKQQRMSLAFIALCTVTISSLSGQKRMEFDMAESLPSAVPSQKPAVPEMVASTVEPFLVSSVENRIHLQIHSPRGPGLGRETSTLSMFLQIENVTCTSVAPNVAVYANVPEGEQPLLHPELYVGTMDSFGLAELSLPKNEHGGSGKNYTLNMTRLFHTLLLRSKWNSKELTLTLLPSYSEWGMPTIHIGRVSLYLQ